MAVPKSKRSSSRCKERRSVITKNFLKKKLKKKLFFINKLNFLADTSKIHIKSNKQKYKASILKLKNIK